MTPGPSFLDSSLTLHYSVTGTFLSGSFLLLMMCTNKQFSRGRHRKEGHPMIASWIPNALALLLFSTTGTIALRAGYLSKNTHHLRLLILAVAMGVISLTAAGDYVSSNLPGLALHTDWFLYLGQAVSYLFLF